MAAQHPGRLEQRYAKTHTTTWNPDQQAEMDQRTAADVRWLDQAFLDGVAPLPLGRPAPAELALLHGDGHLPDDAWTLHPYYDVPNFHRIVVHGSSFPLEWLKLSIDPRAAWENGPTPTSLDPFSWQRETQAQLTPTP